MDTDKPYSVPLVRVASRFHKQQTFWTTRLTRDEHLRDIGSIDYIDSDPHNLDDLLVSSLARISVYDSNTLEIKRTFKTNTQFQVYGGCYRKKDGRLLAAGSEEGKVFVFESNNASPLRICDLKAPTHRVVFMDNTLITFSDDWTIRLLDVGSGQTLRSYGGSKTRDQNFHNDYIRCGITMDRLFASGSYDNFVKLWDPRIDDLKPVMEFDHGHSVESLCQRGGTLLASVGGNKLHVYDMVAGKTLTSIIPKHHKTITCVANYDDKYLLTGGLDGYLNVLDFNYEQIHKFTHDEAQILSLHVNPKLLAVGFNNHHVQLKRFKDFIKRSNDEMAEFEKLQSGYFGPNMVTRYFHEAVAEDQDPAATRRAMIAMKQKKEPVALGDVPALYDRVVIPRMQKRDFSKRPLCQKLLAGFQHSRALEVALTNRDDPEGVIYVLQQLIKRDKVKNAISGCRKIIALIRFIDLNISDIRHNRILLDIGLILIDQLLDDRALTKCHADLWILVEKLCDSVSTELNVVDKCALTVAQLNTVISQY